MSAGWLSDWPEITLRARCDWGRAHVTRRPAIVGGSRSSGILANGFYEEDMSTMNISLPAKLKAFWAASQNPDS